jgi:hypothetical protein
MVQGVGLRFEAEATGWLQNKSIAMTADAAKYDNKDVTAKVLAILTPGKGPVASAEVTGGGGDAKVMAIFTWSMLVVWGSAVLELGQPGMGGGGVSYVWWKGGCTLQQRLRPELCCAVEQVASSVWTVKYSAEVG